MKKIIPFIILGIVAIISLVVAIFGFGMFCVASIPFQDPQLAPASALVKQNIEIIAGAIMMIGGLVLCGASVVGVCFPSFGFIVFNLSLIKS